MVPPVASTTTVGREPWAAADSLLAGPWAPAAVTRRTVTASEARIRLIMEPSYCANSAMTGLQACGRMFPTARETGYCTCTCLWTLAGHGVLTHRVTSNNHGV